MPVALGPDLAQMFAVERHSRRSGCGARALNPTHRICEENMPVQNLSVLCAPFTLHTRAPEMAWPTRPGIADLYLYAHAGPDICLAGNDEDSQPALDRLWARAAAS